MSRLQDLLLQGTRAGQPLATDVSPGVLYFVTDEGVTEQSDGATWSAYSGTATGDVTGPGSATADHVVSFNGTTGKIIKDSGVAIADVVTLTGMQTLTNKTLTSPAISTPTGIVKGDVGLGNVDNTSDATKNAAMVTLANKTLTAPILTGVIPLEAATSGHPALKASSTTLQTRLGDDSTFAPIETGNAKFNGTYYSPLVNDGNSSTALTIDLATGNEHKFTLTGNVTLTLSNPVAGGRYVIEILTGAGGFSVTWPGTVLWPGGTDPVITIGASKIDLITLFYDGTNYLGAFAQDFS